MAISRVEEDEIRQVADLFDSTNETLVWSCLQGCMGVAYANQSRTSAQIVTGDFCFFGGVASERLVKNRPEEYPSDYVVMVPHNEECEHLIQKFYPETSRKITRYAIKKEKHIFDQKQLCRWVSELPEEYELRRIDEGLYHRILKKDWSRDLVGNYGDYQDFYQNGMGYVILHHQEIVSGASSYSYYIGGIEIEVDTREDYRSRGLATVASSQLILSCLEQNLYPSWDAHNLISVALAEKLGYHLAGEYTAYEVYSYGIHSDKILVEA